jgi:hypothetical protein
VIGLYATITLTSAETDSNFARIDRQKLSVATGRALALSAYYDYTSYQIGEKLGAVALIREAGGFDGAVAGRKWAI